MTIFQDVNFNKLIFNNSTSITQIAFKLVPDTSKINSEISESFTPSVRILQTGL